MIAKALSETDGCELHLENTAGTGGTLGRSFDELAALLEAAGGDERLGICLDSCHLLASGYDIRTIDGVSQVIDEFDEIVGLDRLRSLHLNDSQTPLGSNRDRHADIGEGEIGETGLRGVPLGAAIRHTAVRARDSRPRSAGTDQARSSSSAPSCASAGRTARRRAKAACGMTAKPRPGDALVVFGITGDLAKQMTLRSLYRLDARGLLDCPVIGRRRRRLDGRAAA